MKKVKLYCLLGLLGLAIEVNSQTLEYIQYTSMNTGSNELMSSTVGVLSVDIDNTLWISQGHDIGKKQLFDGIHWTYSNTFPIETSGIPVQFLPDGSFWMTSRLLGSFHFYDNNNQTWSNYQIPGVLTSVNQVFLASNNILYLSVVNDGIYLYENGVFSHYSSLNGLPNNSIFKIAEDPSGRIWLATNGGLCSFDQTNWISYFPEALFGGDHTNANPVLHIDHNGNIYNGRSKYLYKFEGGNWTYLDLSTISYVNSSYSITADDYFSSITSDTLGTLYVTIVNKGIIRFDGSDWYHYHDQNSNISNFASNSVVDNQGLAWFSFNPGGIAKFDGNGFERWDTWDGLAENSIYSITQDKDSAMHFITERGLSKFHSNWETFFQYSIPVALKSGKFGMTDSLEPAFPLAGGRFAVWNDTDWTVNTHGLNLGSPNVILMTSNDTAFCGGTNGLARVVGPNWNYGANQFTYTGLPHINVLALREWNNHVWFGTQNGLGYLNNNQVVEVPIHGEIISTTINDLLVDHQNTLWLASTNGVGKYDGTNWDAITTTHGLPSNNTFCLYQAKDSSIWVGTDSGACQITDTVWNYFNTSNYLLGNKVRSIYQDFDNNMWLGTDQGLVVLNPIADTSGLRIEHINHEIIIYPNPARDYLFIENGLPNSTIEIYNLSGTLVQTEKSSGSGTRINIRSLNTGCYILKNYNQANKISKKIEVIR